MKYILSPSILAADFNKLGEQMKDTQKAGAGYLHFDVMDGVFVPSISFGIPVLQSICGTTEQVMDVHLMITDPIRYIEEFAKAGADIITVHYEACEDVKATLAKIRECGKKVGISICPDTPVEVLDECLEEVDMVLIMTVQPGFGGQRLIPETVDKVRKLREKLIKDRRKIDIEVDGGISALNVRQLLEAGANIIVAGSAVFKENTMETTKEMVEILKGYE